MNADWGKRFPFSFRLSLTFPASSFSQCFSPTSSTTSTATTAAAIRNKRMCGGKKARKKRSLI